MKDRIKSRRVDTTMKVEPTTDQLVALLYAITDDGIHGVNIIIMYNHRNESTSRWTCAYDGYDGALVGRAMGPSSVEAAAAAVADANKKTDALLRLARRIGRVRKERRDG